MGGVCVGGRGGRWAKPKFSWGKTPKKKKKKKILMLTRKQLILTHAYTTTAQTLTQQT